MKAKKVWIATNPFNECDQEVRLDEPNHDATFFSESDDDYSNGTSVEWQEYIAIPVET